MNSNSNIADQLVSTFKNLPASTQSEVFVAIAEIMASNNPELKETFLDQLEDEQKGDYWDTLSERQKKELIQALREVDEGKTYGHEQVKQEAQTWLKK